MDNVLSFSLFVFGKNQVHNYFVVAYIAQEYIYMDAPINKGNIEV